MSAKVSVVSGSVTRWKLQVEQPVMAQSVLTGVPCSEPSCTSAVPASGWDQGHYTPAKTSLSELLHFSQALKENKDKIQLMEQLLSATGHKQILTTFQTTYYNQWIF